MQWNPWLAVFWLLEVGVPMTPLSGTGLGYALIGVASIIGVWQGWKWAAEREWSQGTAKFLLFMPTVLLAVMGILWSYESREPSGGFLTMKQFDEKTVKTVNCYGRKKVNEKVALDGIAYRNCIFENVTFVYNGTAPFSFSDNNTFIGSKHLVSDSAMVNYTLSLIRDLGWISGKLNVQDEIPSPEGSR